MADFCNVCSREMFGEEIQPDINVHTLIENLKPGYGYSVLCEGCAMVSVEKDSTGTASIVTISKDSEKNTRWTIEEWESGKASAVFS